MKADLDIRLEHDGEQWLGHGLQLPARGETLMDLDAHVGQLLRASGDFPPGSRVTVFMGYDFDTFPTWLRQYHNHYFNRYVEFDV